MRTKETFWLSFILFLGLLFILPQQFIPVSFGETILTVTSFLFGIIAGFYIVVTTTDYNNVKNILATETAAWIQLYRNVVIYEPDSSEELADMIDRYMRRNFDFELIDYARNTTPEYLAIVHEIDELPFKTKLVSVHQVIRGFMGTIETSRQQLTVLGTRTLSQFQWYILLILAALFISSLYGLRDGSIFFNIVTLGISCAIVLVLLLIHDLDLYVWNERTFGFEIFENVFRAIGKQPYYPSESIDDGRVKPTDREYRVGVLSGGPGSARRIEIRHAA